jgi:hypothetical protein
MDLLAFGYTAPQRVCDTCFAKFQPERMLGHVGAGFSISHPDVL